jgi:small redox-active disulfide protein 2
MTIEILVLGTGCKTCHATEDLVKEVVAENNLDATVELVTDLQTILSYGLMRPPGIVINGDMKYSGAIPSKDEVLKLLEEA